MTALSGTLDTAEQELRKLLLSENARLSEKIEENTREALNALSCAAAELRHDLVSRSSLSSVFTEAAIKYSSEWSVPSPAPAPENEPSTNPTSRTRNRNRGS